MKEDVIASLAATLRELGERGGQAALMDERRVRGKLADSSVKDAAACNIVVEALKIGVPDRLREADPHLMAIAVAREATRLQRQFGVEGAFARGAVRAWAQALDLEAVKAEPDEQLVWSDPEPRPQPGPVKSAWIYRGIAALVLAGAVIAAYRFLNPPVPPPVVFADADPATWPIAGDKAVLWPRTGCPQGWATAAAGCVHAAKDLGTLSVTPNYSLPPGTALYFDVIEKKTVCPAGSAMESAQYCLRETTFPNETTVTLISNDGRTACETQSQISIPLQHLCLERPRSPALRPPWRRSNPLLGDSPFLPSRFTLAVQRPPLLCPSAAILENDVGFCLLSN